MGRRLRRVRLDGVLRLAGDGARVRDRRGLAAEAVGEVLRHAVGSVRRDVPEPDLLLGVVEVVRSRARAAENLPTPAVLRPEKTA